MTTQNTDQIALDLAGLDDSCGLVRTARKPWRCVCEKEISWWNVRRICEHGWSEGRVKTEAEARDRMERQKGSLCHGGKTPTDERFEITPRLNPEHRQDCLGEIAVGDRYFEYLGEAAAWESGTRYCARCAVAVWAGKS